TRGVPCGWRERRPPRVFPTCSGRPCGGLRMPAARSAASSPASSGPHPQLPATTPPICHPPALGRDRRPGRYENRRQIGTIGLMFDSDAYLRRIGLDPADKPAWRAVHRAHATTIPFENLDSHRGIPVSLEQADLERKLGASGRGGYCFEHNLLLASALEHMGLEVEPMLARVRVGGAPRETRPASHLVLRATDRDGRQWNADVGFGLGTLLVPRPCGPARVHGPPGQTRQLVEARAR